MCIAQKSPPYRQVWRSRTSIEKNPTLSSEELRISWVETTWIFGMFYANNCIHTIFKKFRLLSADYESRVEHCQWILNQCEQESQFPRSVIFTDEASFFRNGIFNYHNNNFWADENPHSCFPSEHQQRFNVNVWAGIINGTLIEPYILQRLTGSVYFTFFARNC